MVWPLVRSLKKISVSPVCGLRIHFQPKIVFAEGRNEASESLELGNGAVGIGDFDDALAAVDVQLAPQAIAQVDGIVRKLLKAGALFWQ